MSEPGDEATAKIRAPHPTGDEPDAWDRTADWVARHGALPALGVLTIALAVIYRRVFAGEIAGDDLTFHFAESARLADCLRHGDFDLWNPSANGGFASAYYYQVLPQLASALPTAVFGHHLFWFQLSVFLPLVLAPAAAYRGMRLLGAVPWQAVSAAFVIAFTIGKSRWGFSADGTFSVGLYTQTWAFAAFPLALGHTVRWALAGQGLAAALAWSAFVGLCHPFAVIALGLALLVGFVGHLVVHQLQRVLATLGASRWQPPPPQPFGRQFLRLAVFAILLAVSQLPVLAPLLVDYAGFGGFPHRVNDEVGPGFKQLGSWHVSGMILDHGRVTVLTWALPVVLLFARGALFRWLWVPALVYALLLGLGPHLGKTGDDLLPAVRFLGALQIVLALGIGAGAYTIAKTLWDAGEDSWLIRGLRRVLRVTRMRIDPHSLQYAVRTAIAALAAALAVLVAVPGAKTQSSRVRVLKDFPGSHRAEMMQIIDKLKTLPPGRKQVGPGCENHWWNLLSYVYARVPATLQMGGGGLQASPNYDFLWSVRDVPKIAHLFDAPYFVFEKSKASTQPVGEDLLDTGTYLLRRLPSPGLVSAVEVTGVLPPGPTGAGTATRKAALAWAKSRAPLEDRVLAYGETAVGHRPPSGQTLRAWRQDSPGDAADIVAEVEATAPTTFMFRESWHPRWHAYLDGKEVAVRRVTPDFPAVDVPPGTHVIQLRFERPWWAQAAWLAWPGIALLAWLVLRVLARRREA